MRGVLLRKSDQACVEDFVVISWALGFLGLAISAVLLHLVHLGGPALASAATAQLVFFVSLIFFALSLFAGTLRRG